MAAFGVGPGKRFRSGLNGVLTHLSLLERSAPNLASKVLRLTLGLGFPPIGRALTASGVGDGNLRNVAQSAAPANGSDHFKIDKGRPFLIKLSC